LQSPNVFPCVRNPTAFDRQTDLTLIGTVPPTLLKLRLQSRSVVAAHPADLTPNGTVPSPRPVIENDGPNAFGETKYPSFPRKRNVESLFPGKSAVFCAEQPPKTQRR